MNGIEPADVYALVTHLSYVLYIAIGLLVLKMGVTIWAWFDVHAMLQRVEEVNTRVERLLNMATIHGEITDAQKTRMAEALGEIREEATKTAVTAAKVAKETVAVVVSKVEQVPDRVVDKIREREAGDSGVNKSPTPPSPPSPDPPG